MLLLMMVMLMVTEFVLVLVTVEGERESDDEGDDRVIVPDQLVFVVQEVHGGGCSSDACGDKII